MSTPPAPPGPTPPERARSEARTVAIALAITLGAQTLASFAMHSPSVFAPVATRELGVPADRVGMYVVISYAFAMLVGLASPMLIARFGPLRSVQIVALLIAAGLATGATGWIATVLAAAAIIGTANGTVGPVSSQILAERSPPRMMNLIFSIKQTGVPMGGALAGAIVPAMILAVGWRWTLAAMALVGIAFALALQPLRREYDRRRDPNARLSIAAAYAQMRASVALTWRDRVLRDLGFVAGAYVGTQLTVMTYFVTFLNLELGHSLVVAGFVFSVVQITGVLGRVLWGAVGDRMRRPRLLLGALGVASGIAAVLIALMTPAWPVALVLAVGIFFGITGLSWNGLYFAEVARRVRREDVSRATGAGMFFSFLGGISGPVIFALVVPGAGGGGFALGFGLIAVMAFVAGTYLIARTPRIVPAPD